MAHLPNCEIPKYESLLEMSGRFPSMNPRAILTFLRVLTASDELFRGASTVFVKHQISKGKFMLLMQLFDKETGTSRKLSPAEMATALQVTRATVTGLLDGLERDDLVTRVRDEKDKRMVLVSLTDSGIDILEELLPLHFENVTMLMSGLSEEEQDQLTQLLAKLTDYVGEVVPDNTGMGCDICE